MLLMLHLNMIGSYSLIRCYQNDPPLPPSMAWCHDSLFLCTEHELMARPRYYCPSSACRQDSYACTLWPCSYPPGMQPPFSSTYLANNSWSLLSSSMCMVDTSSSAWTVAEDGKKKGMAHGLPQELASAKNKEKKSNLNARYCTMQHYLIKSTLSMVISTNHKFIIHRLFPKSVNRRVETQTYLNSLRLSLSAIHYI